MSVLIAATVGMLFAAGLVLLYAGIRGYKILPEFQLTYIAASPQEALAVIAGVIAAVMIVFTITGWVVPSVAAGAGVWFGYRTLKDRSSRESEIGRIEAIAAWTEMIRDNMAAAAGLEQALVASTQHAPGPIAVPLRRFERRVNDTPLLESLAMLGEDLNHPSADLVTVAIANAVRSEARELAPLLSRLATFIRGDVRMRQRVAVSRARIRTSARIVVGTTIVTVLFLYIFSPRLLDVYDTPFGQVWMGVVFGVFGLGYWLLNTLGEIQQPGRFKARRAAILGEGDDR